jgi:invasion protein IalB
MAAAAIWAVGGAPLALGQPTTPAPSGPAPAGPKPQVPPKPQPKKPAAPSTAVQPAPSPEPKQPAAIPQTQLIFSPWTKICGKDGPAESNAKTVCLVVKEARLETGQLGAGAALVEPEGEPRKVLRVTLPLGMQIPQGTRVNIDQNALAQRPHLMCLPNGCLSDYDADAEVVGRLKKGQGLVIQAVSAGGEPISLALPLADFAKAYDGPATDQKAFAEQQKKLDEELQRRAEEARKKLESQQPQPSQSGGEAPPAAGK